MQLNGDGDDDAAKAVNRNAKARKKNYSNILMKFSEELA